MSEVVAQARTICPKAMTYGPCGGVAAAGTCEIDITLTCPYPPIAEQLPWRLNRDPRAASIDLAQPSVDLRAENRSALARKIRQGELVIVAEMYTPDSADIQRYIARYQQLAGSIDAINIANNALATPHVSTLAVAAACEQVGLPTIMNLTCRDHNRIGLQSEMLGAAALGVQHLFCITGDHPALGDHKIAKGVFDLDSFQLIQLARRLRDAGEYASGRALAAPPTWLIGAAGSPFSHPLHLQAERTAAKVHAGAEFIQTQAVFGLQPFTDYLAQLHDLNVLDHAWLIIGVGVVTRLEQARWLRQSVPGAYVPDDLVDLLRRTPASQRRAVGISYAHSLTEQLRQLDGVSGVLLFAFDDDVESLGELLAL